MRLQGVNTPTLYVKRGCPYCAAATDYLDEHSIAFEEVNVRGDEARMKRLGEISGQTRTPTMVWEGKVLANFGVDELKKFLAEQGAGQS